VRQPLTTADKRRLRKQAREHYEEDWLAPFGSEQEKQLLRIWAKCGRVSQEDRKLIDEWLKDPAGRTRGNGSLSSFRSKAAAACAFSALSFLLKPEGRGPGHDRMDTLNRARTTSSTSLDIFHIYF
jgi:hypothetical protein